MTRENTYMQTVTITEVTEIIPTCLKPPSVYSQQLSSQQEFFT